jgi:hypothetical protein
MDYDAHYQAFYDGLRTGMNNGGFTDVPLLAIHSQDTQTADAPAEPPYVVYTEETQRNLGAMEAGPVKVVTTGWRVTIRTRDLQDMLDIASALTDELELEDLNATADGYVTTAITQLGAQTLWEVDSKLHAKHLRFDWERSK